MPSTLAQLAESLSAQGVPCRIEGDSQRPIHAVATLEDAGPTDITFLSNPKYEKMLGTTRAAAVIVRTDQVVPDGMTVLRVPDPYEANARLMVLLHGYRRHPFAGVSPAASIAPSARIGDGAAIAHGVTVMGDAVIGRNVVLYPGVFIGPGCSLGDDCVMYPNVVVYDRCVLGHRVTIHAGSVIGQDGLGYAPVGDRWHKIPQAGIVEIGDDVEIGACCAIDRATLGKTIIGSGTKFSNLIAIGHGTRIGPNCMFVAQVGVAGSVNVGKHVTMAGKAGVAGHLTIGDGAQIAAMAGVMRDVPEGTKVLGAPAMEMSEAKRMMSAQARLPELRDRVRALERELAELRARLASDNDTDPRRA